MTAKHDEGTRFSLCSVVFAQQVSFEQADGARLLTDSSTAARIIVDGNDWIGVRRAAGDLAHDFGRVTGQNGSVVLTNQTTSFGNSTSLPIVLGTLGRSTIIDGLVSAGQIDVSRVEGQWESYLIQSASDVPGVGDALVIAGADRRGTIYGIYDLSQQMGVSPWYWWADVGVLQRSAVYATGELKVQPTPSVKYRGVFLNDEQPGLTNWVQTQYPDLPSGSPNFGAAFYSKVFELLLRLRANYLWPTMWASMFYVDDEENGRIADEFGIVMGTSHTEPMARATNEQQNPRFMGGPWSWDTNRENMTEFLRAGAERSKDHETLWTLGMRGHGDNASPTLDASSLESIVQAQQDILKDVLDSPNLENVPMMWCLYKEVGNYFAAGMDVPDDITLLWAEDNWGNAQRLPYGAELERSGGSGLYYHVDYVGDPRDYKWINTISLQKSWSELLQAYQRGAQRIWILNVGDLKPLELPMQHFLDMAYNITLFESPDSTQSWLTQWSSRNFGEDAAQETARILANYSMLAGRRKYELVDARTYSIINYGEADRVLQEWSNIVDAAQRVYDSLDASVQPGFFEMVLHPALAGATVHQIHINTAKNNLYTVQGRSSTNTIASDVLRYFNDDHQLTQRYHELLDGKWSHMLDQTHLNYQYWQQPMRNSLAPLGYVQQQEMSLAGGLGVTAEGNNGTVPGDDNYHALSSNVLTLPPMDPYGPSTRWIDVFSRGNLPVNYNLSASHPSISFSSSSGTLSPNGTVSSTDNRIFVSVDWSLVTNATTMVTINVTASMDLSSSAFINFTRRAYGNFNMPQIMLPLNKTSAPSTFSGFVESDRTLAFEAEHFTSITNSSTTSNGSAYLATIPGYGRTLSGIALLPFTAPSQPISASSPHLTYDIFTFTPSARANVSVWFGPALNTHPQRPLRYAVSVDDAAPTVVQPVPTTVFGSLPGMWSAMVSNAVMGNTTAHDLGTAGAHRVNLWLLEPGLVVQKVVVDLGGVRVSYLGPPESRRVGGG
ncbi:hypothetical protein BDZ85DRAFT_74493 [Elsinoe ampelina]|uniref:Gylcosyl hydrolase 115 C-terminal domain-containing protein n=1 Tax=Elsinoe ampelina TaxID=302913 RepID=A0A6A6GKD8_9PEZI|nr:hypothetical protein BDZ85DRAFT_74493 [Elsinoe ampelina]